GGERRGGGLPMDETTEASVSLRRARSGDDEFTRWASHMSPWGSGSRQRGQRPAGATAGRGAPHRGQGAWFASAMGSASVVGIQSGRDVLSTLCTSSLSIPYRKSGDG